MTSSPFKPAVCARYTSARHLMQGYYAPQLLDSRLTYNTTVFPVWQSGSQCFTYQRDSREGGEARLVNLTDKSSTAQPGPASLEPSPEQAPCCATKAVDNNNLLSPDGRFVVYAKEHNLWLRDTTTETEKPLTTDGEEYNVYGAVSTGWAASAGGPAQQGLQVRWSPDGRTLFAVQRDTRDVATLPVVHHIPEEGTRPTLEEIKVAYPGDEGIEKVRLFAIDVETGNILETDRGPIPTTRNGYGFFESGLGWWGGDNRHAYFVDVDRYYKYAQVVEFDTHTGKCRVVFKENVTDSGSDTHINLMPNQDAYATMLPLPESNELLWYSERTGWGHLYLYCLKTGKLKNAVTSGPGLVRDVVKYLPEKREVWVQMAAQTKGRDPYYRNLVRVNIDTGEMVKVADSDHEYVVITERNDFFKYGFMAMGCSQEACGVSPDGEYAVVTRSRADEVPVSYVVDRNGNHIMDLETADVSGLPDGWQWPEPVKLKAADGETDTYGLVFRPTHFDPKQSYPVLSHGFNQPEISWVSKGSFTNGVFGGWTYWDALALAELGFIVVQIDGRGGPEREKAFFDHCYGVFSKASDIDDHVAGIKQLAQKYTYIDLERVGFAAHTTGGSGALQALTKYPDFYKVATVSCHHDGRLMPTQMQGDKYNGPESQRLDNSYPEDEVDAIQGKLLLMAGMLDSCTPATGAFRLVEALQKANKDFEMIFLPNMGHGGPENTYLSRRSWDFLVRELLDETPPKEFFLNAAD